MSGGGSARNSIPNNFKMIPYLKTIKKEHETLREYLIKEYCKFIFTEGQGDLILTTIF